MVAPCEITTSSRSEKRRTEKGAGKRGQPFNMTYCWQKRVSVMRRTAYREFRRSRSLGISSCPPCEIDGQTHCVTRFDTAHGFAHRYVLVFGGRLISKKSYQSRTSTLFLGQPASTLWKIMSTTCIPTRKADKVRIDPSSIDSGPLSGRGGI